MHAGGQRFDPLGSIFFIFGGVAQMARASGSYREVMGFDPLRRYNALLRTFKLSWLEQTAHNRPVAGSSPARSMKKYQLMEDYPSPAEGNGLENRQVCKSAQGFESLILL